MILKNREALLVQEQDQLLHDEKLLRRSMAKWKRKANPIFIGRLFKKPADLEAAARELEAINDQVIKLRNRAEDTGQNLLHLREAELSWKQTLFVDIQRNIKPSGVIAPRRHRSGIYSPIDPHSFWGSIRENAFAAKGNRCERCLSDRCVQVHHITPLSSGGTSDLNNLEILCELCHEKEHGRRFTYAGEDFNDYGKERKVISPRAEEIQKAIDSKKDIFIKYKKSDGTVSERRVTPSKVSRKWYGRIILEGYCHLRNDKRTFRVVRIRDLKII